METKNYNSTTNQKITGRFVSEEVLANVTVLIEYVLDISAKSEEPLVTRDDIDNYTVYSDMHGNTLTELERKETLARLTEEIDEIEEELDEIGERIGEGDDYIYILDSVEQNNLTAQLHQRVDILTEEILYLKNADKKEAEVSNWWLVSKNLGEKLKAKGEPVLILSSMYLWGRATGGQAIKMDWVISSICDDLQILEGQTNDWSKTFNT